MGRFIPFILILFVSEFLLMFSGCNNYVQKEEKTEIASNETNPLFVKFRSFQNIDSTWGYTIFVNSRPYLHYSRLTYKKTVLQQNAMLKLWQVYLLKRYKMVICHRSLVKTLLIVLRYR
jgi:hypothetical protein